MKSVVTFIAIALTISFYVTISFYANAEPQLGPKLHDSVGSVRIHGEDVEDAHDPIVMPAPYDLTITRMQCYMESAGDGMSINISHCVQDDPTSCTSSATIIACTDGNYATNAPSSSADVDRGELLKLTYFTFTSDAIVDDIWITISWVAR